MKCLWRNKRKMYYRLWEGMQETIDEDGNILETNVPIYGEPKLLKANISVEEGRAFRESTSVEMFGIDVFYDKVVVIDRTDLPITETTVFYVDKSPYETDAFDYRVTRVATSLNSTLIALKRVDVS